VEPWNFAYVWEAVAAVQPERPAIIQGDRVVSWAELDGQANALAAAFLDAGLGHQAKVGCYLYNCPEYLIATYAAFKAGMVPFNVNYRYGPEELAYLFDNADAEVVVFDAEFAGRLDSIRERLPLVKLWIAVARPDAPVPAWGQDYDDLALHEVKAPVRGPWGISGDDLFFIYTGGTTGLPKGVMWRQADIFAASKYGANPALGVAALDYPSQAGERALSGTHPVSMIPPPLMHAVGHLGAFAAFGAGGTAAFLPGRRFDAVEMWNEVERLRAARISSVGLAFCTPMLEALDANPARWDLTCVRAIGSSGAMWSIENKQGLLRHLPQAWMMDSFGASEAVGMGASTSTAQNQSDSGRFLLGEFCAVFAEDGRRVTPGSGEKGRVALGGPIPQGYYKDEAKTAETFRVIDGERWSMPGDWATVEADGGLTLLGRGSQCINTGGEKVFPEEVEEALKRHPAVRDAAVAGVPDARFGEAVVALVELNKGHEPPGLDEMKAFVRGQLADYKAPRAIGVVDTVGRAPNGKLDYKAVKAAALALR